MTSNRLETLTYVSRATCTINLGDLAAIAAVRNQAVGISGVLIAAGPLFFQTIEGPAPAIDDLLNRLLRDPRHTELVVLRRASTSERQFADWGMRPVDLASDREAILAMPLRLVLAALGESHQILAQYTQPTVLRLLQAGIDPTQVAPQATERVVLFADLAAFSSLCEQLPFAQVAALVNRYFAVGQASITAAGGEVAKLIGDSIMAWFPLDRAADAVVAAIDIQSRLADLRAHAGASDPMQLLHAGIGLAAGTVIEGNMGGHIKLDYTLMGPAVNQAARLEALTRDLGHCVLMGPEVAARAAVPMQAVGLHLLKGFRVPVAVWAPMTGERAPSREQISQQFSRFFAGSLEQAG